jgi:multisubunit Na+/H+ antiporter MnhE subunit
MTNPNSVRPDAGADGEVRRGSQAVRRATAWLGWWMVLMAFWVITDNSIALDELLAGASAAALAAFLVDVASHQAAVTFGLRLAWMRQALRLPRQVLTETGNVFAALWRRMARGEEPASGFVAQPVAYGPDTPEAKMRRALLVGARSLAPNTFVLGIDRDRNLMIMHKLVVGDRGTRR